MDCLAREFGLVTLKARFVIGFKPMVVSGKNFPLKFALTRDPKSVAQGSNLQEPEVIESRRFEAPRATIMDAAFVKLLEAKGGGWA